MYDFTKCTMWVFLKFKKSLKINNTHFANMQPIMLYICLNIGAIKTPMAVITHLSCPLDVFTWRPISFLYWACMKVCRTYCFRRRIAVHIGHPKDVREKRPQRLKIRRPILVREGTIKGRTSIGRNIYYTVISKS